MNVPVDIPLPSYMQVGVTVAILLGGVVLSLVLRRSVDQIGVRRGLSTLAMRPLRTAVTCVTMIVAVALALDQYQINLLYALSTILALIAIGFVAVWSVLSNMLCSFLLILLRPFEVNDEIEFPGDPIKGRVHDLNLVFTTLRDETGALFQIPNNVFFQKPIKRIPGAEADARKAAAASPL